MDSLVVLGTRVDPHVEVVVEKILEDPAAKVFVLDYRDDTRFAASVDPHGGFKLEVNGEIVPPFIVWDRRKLVPGSALYVEGDEEHSGYIAQEWRALYTLIAGISGDRVVNTLKARACMIKPYQQMIAARSGLKSPSTLVSNDLDSVLSMQSTVGGLILKSLSGAKISTHGEGEHVPFNVMTMRVSKESLASADASSIACCPHFFQKEVVKSHKLRVVCIDQDIVAFRINSQVYESTRVDWRKAIDVIEFEQVELDPRIHTCVLRFMSAMGLAHGSIDLLVDRDGETWFLECNQDGAWAWLDIRCDGRISDLIASSFLKRMRASGKEIRSGLSNEAENAGVA